jgi:hypothetical protein
MKGTPRRVTAVAFAVAYIVCVAVQPDPNSSNPPDPWWVTALNIASVATMLILLIALWVGAHHAPTLGVVVGIGMVAETFAYPNHTQDPFGWWTGVQAALFGRRYYGERRPHHR